MTNARSPLWFLMLAGLLPFCIQPPERAAAAESNPSLPEIIQAGFDSWSRGAGFDGALYIWQKGGLMEGDRRTAELSNRVRRVSQALGNYSGCELLKTEPIGKSSEVFYLALSFQRGAIFARFVLYRTEKGRVVQDMDFSPRPEAILPWITFAADRNAD